MKRLIVPPLPGTEVNALRRLFTGWLTGCRLLVTRGRCAANSRTRGLPAVDDRHLQPMRRRRSRALVTAAGPRMRPVLYDLSLPTFARYASRWEWQLLVEDLVTDVGGTAEWDKLRLIRQALEGYDLVLWLDAETLLLRDDQDVTDHLHPDHFQALGLEHVPAEHRINPTTGAWLLRSHPATFQFLDAVDAAGPQPGPWAVQGAVLAALGWDRGDEHYHWSRPGAGNVHLSGTSWLPQSWNQQLVDVQAEGRPRVPDPHVLHFHGMPATDRYRSMARVIGRPADVCQVAPDLAVTR